MATCSSGPAVGSKSAIHVGQEECWGVLVRPTHLIDFTGESIQATENTITSNSIRRDRAIHKLVPGTLDVTGDINSELSASGFGILIYNALGNYLKLEDSQALGGAADGGRHARLEVGSVELLVDAAGGGTHDLDRDAFIELAPETSTTFSNAGTPLDNRIAVVNKVGLSKTLTFDDNVGSGHSYYTYGGREVSCILSIGAVAADPIHGVAGCTPIVLEQVYDSTGTLVDPDVNLNGGVLYAGPNRVRLPYLAAVKTGSGTTVYLQPSTLLASGYTATVDHAVIVAPTFVVPQSTFLVDALKGSWVFQWYAGGGAVDYSNVWTHFLEAGEDLPEGLTIEVDRDKAIFTYAGMKVNTMSVEFPSQEIITATFSFLGRQEYAMAILEGDICSGVTSIVVSKAEHFSDPQLFPVGSQIGYARVGEEEFTYTTLTDNSDGTYTLSGIPASGDGAITRTHLKRSNVDLMSSLTLEGIDVNPVIKGNVSPLTTFETLVTLDGFTEEVLNGSITFNNNLNGDKFGLGSRYRFGIVAEQRTVEASLNVEFDDGKLYKKFKENEFFTLEFKGVSQAGDSEIDTTGVFHQMYFFLPKCRFTGTTPNASDQSYIVTDMPTNCIYDDDYDTAELVVIIVNKNEQDVVA